MELLARADARTEALLDRLRQAEEERADAQRDARIAEHKLESARSEAEELRGERDRLRTQFERAPKVVATMNTPDTRMRDGQD